MPIPDSYPLGIAVAEDGTVWFTEQWGNGFTRLDPPTDPITEYPLPRPESRLPRLLLASPVSVSLTLAVQNRIGRLSLTGFPQARRLLLGISAAAQPSAICGPTGTHQITISWEVSRVAPPLRVTIELTDPSGITYRMGGQPREGEATLLDLDPPGHHLLAERARGGHCWRPRRPGPVFPFPAALWTRVSKGIWKEAICCDI